MQPNFKFRHQGNMCLQCQLGLQFRNDLRRFTCTCRTGLATAQLTMLISLLSAVTWLVVLPCGPPPGQ